MSALIVLSLLKINLCFGFSLLISIVKLECVLGLSVKQLLIVLEREVQHVIASLSVLEEQRPMDVIETPSDGRSSIFVIEDNYELCTLAG